MNEDGRIKELSKKNKRGWTRNEAPVSDLEGIENMTQLRMPCS